MFGFAYINLTGINPVSNDAQDLDTDTVKSIEFSAKNNIVVIAKGLTDCGPVFIENIKTSNGAITGYIPGLNKNIAVESGKITFSTPS